MAFPERHRCTCRDRGWLDNGAADAMIEKLIGGLPSTERNSNRHVKFSLDFSGFTMSNNMPGFGNGYKDAVEYYFSKSD